MPIFEYECPEYGKVREFSKKAVDESMVNEFIG
jgi:hypothetical protein